MLQLQNKPALPILKWVGGKSGILGGIKNFFPLNFNNYFEPFVGGGAVFFALSPTVKATINDANPELINLYQMVRDHPEEIMGILDDWQLQYSELFYYHLRGITNSDPVEKAARTIFLNKTCFNGLYRQNQKGEFNVSFGKREKCPQLYDRFNFLRASQHLQNAQLFCGDFEKIIDLAGEGDLVYCDPPYIPVAESSFNYTGDGFGVSDHERLNEAAKRAIDRGADVVISNSDCPLVRKIYEGWQFRTVSAARAINSNGVGRGKIQELVMTPPKKRIPFLKTKRRKFRGQLVNR